METLELMAHNLHEVRLDDEDRRLLFHVPSTALFEADEAVTRIIDALRTGHCTREELHARLPAYLEPGVLDGSLQDLRTLEIVVEQDRPVPLDIRSQQVQRTALNTLVLNVSTGCNLSCTYCYKEDLDTPGASKRMNIETAKAAVEMLLRESPQEPRYTIVFLGGEPLTHLPFIKDAVAYCERRFAEAGKAVEFVMTTNATLLTPATVDYLDKHRFGLSISMDGPQAIHDRHRKTIGGVGSYATVRRKVDMLLSRYRSRPVGARVTLTAGVTDVEYIWEHLFREVGFAEVGFAPVTSGPVDTFNLSPAEVVQVFAGMKQLGQRYLAAALHQYNIGFSNMHQLLTNLYHGYKKSLPCGAGLKMLSVNHAGELDLCHRFTGSELSSFGNVQTGVDTPRLTEFLSARLKREGTGCATCYIRNLCAGGCYHESYAHYGNPVHPTYHYCELMRDWVDFGISIYSRIQKANPGFFARYINTRKAS
jgi:uncharacterized protein